MTCLLKHSQKLSMFQMKNNKMYLKGGDTSFHKNDVINMVNIFLSIYSFLLSLSKSYLLSISLSISLSFVKKKIKRTIGNATRNTLVLFGALIVGKSVKATQITSLTFFNFCKSNLSI